MRKAGIRFRDSLREACLQRCTRRRQVGVSLRLSLDKTGFPERLIRSSLLNRLESSRGDAQRYGLIELRNVNPLSMQIKLPANDSRRVELRRAGAVRVPSGALWTSFCNRTNFHVRNHEYLISNLEKY